MKLFRGLDSVGDWMMGQGLGSYAKDADAVALDVATKLRSWKGNCFFDPQTGVDWGRRLDKGQKLFLVAELQTVILSVNGVVRINSLDVNLNPITRAISVAYNINTIYTSGFQSTLNIIAGGPPSA